MTEVRDTRPARILWGLPDALLCWMAGYLGAILASFPLYATAGGTDIDSKLVFGIILPAQQLTVVLAVVYISRLKGQRSLAGDFGFRIRLSDARYLVIGAVFEVLLTLALLPILQLDHRVAKNQQLLSDLRGKPGCRHGHPVLRRGGDPGPVGRGAPVPGRPLPGGSSGRSGRSRPYSSRRSSSPWCTS